MRNVPPYQIPNALVDRLKAQQFSNRKSYLRTSALAKLLVKATST